MGQTMNVKVGESIEAVLAGHSALNGAVIPAGSTIAATSNAEAVLVAPVFVLPEAGAESLVASLVILGPGSTDLHVVVTAPDGTLFEDTTTVTVEVVEPGLLRVELSVRRVGEAAPPV